MSVFRLTLIAFSLNLLVGCALFNALFDGNFPYPDKGLRQAEGRHINELVDKIGFPSHVGKVGSYEVYTWIYDGGEVTQTLPGAAGPTFHTSSRFCEIKVSVNANGIVGRWEWDGNRCGVFGEKLNQ